MSPVSLEPTVLTGWRVETLPELIEALRVMHHSRRRILVTFNLCRPTRWVPPYPVERLLEALEQFQRSDGHFVGCPGEQFHDRPEHACEAIWTCVRAREALG